MTCRAVLLCGATVLALWSAPAVSQSVAPFSEAELNRIVTLLVDSQQLQPSTRIARVAVEPIAKSGPAHRRARITLVGQAGTREALIDLNVGTVLNWVDIKEGRAPVLSAEWARATAAVKADPDWQVAMARRGYTSYEDIFCESLSAGYFPDTPAARTRVLRMPCYDVSAAQTNVYARPIEGIVTTVDARSGEVLEVLEEGVIPTPPAGLEPPVALPSPDVALAGDVTIEGNHISFEPWDMTVRLDDQFGMVLADVGFRHVDTRRPVLAEGHVSEIFVPYMDPTESWAFRTYLDAGEFGLGTLTSPLLAGVDCPTNADYLGVQTLTPLGRVRKKPRAICIFSRDMQGPLWRHYEALNGTQSGVVARELVVRSIASIAHYDYVMDWVFRPQGDIEIRVGATGIDAVKAIGTDAPDSPFGRRVTPHLSAVYHDHFFSLRLDLDIDGPANRLVREHVRPVEQAAGPLKRSYWQLEPETIQTEGPAVSSGPGVWRVESATRTNALGQPTAYQLVPQGTVSLLRADDYPQRRGAFSAHSLWVTRHAANERAAAGAYPNQSAGGSGLPQFANTENIDGADLVLWPTIGFRHITRPEDWPILSTVWKSVLLRPYGFFDANPTVPGSDN